ncbi:TPA: restriction endonuclease subunit S, partial [Staphylococcus pseudintermedius]|nr:restriction endonuclease subunit S [Staphylococcus pseudintermedius]
WVLSNIDKKIKLNRTIIANLEELSQTLFKRWFVDFEFPDKDGNPYKSSGGEISDTNNLPANWKYQSAKDIYTINIGKTPPRKLTELFNTKNGIDWVSISDMKADGPFINITKENLSESAVKEYRVKLVPKNSVLLSFKLTIGRVKITNKELATNEAIAHFVTNTINSIYTYLYLKKFNFESLGNTSSIANAINSKIVKEMPILVPTSEILEKFKEIITPIFEKIELQQKENILLTQLRDTLLPKLMSGEIELPDDIEVNTDELSI